ncbi:MAG: hypothetical protein HYT87_14805 [Nitrospirae bacterium]|nr:hypothetical protein [Nitrospirota bacterium]
MHAFNGPKRSERIEICVGFVDSDGDGFGSGNPRSTDICGGQNSSFKQGDCDDSKGKAFPGNPEVCDDVDNDCDGKVDEGFDIGPSCTVGVGECAKAGTLKCKTDGTDTECNATPGTPSAESCDGKDNDCDGEIDDACALPVVAKLPAGWEDLSCAGSANGKIYCFGGRGIGGAGYFEYEDQIVEYDPARRTVATKSAKLPSARGDLSCAGPANGKIYCFGGTELKGTSHMGVYEIVEYNPASDTVVTKSARLPSARSNLSCAGPANGKIYCFGGVGNEEIVEYDPAGDTVVTKSAKLPSARSDLSCVGPANGKIYCFGGSLGVLRQDVSDQIVEYNPASDTVATKSAKLPSARSDLSCAGPANGKIYCLGGIGGSRFDQIVEYDPAGDTVATKSAKLPSARSDLSCVGPANGKIYCFGGYLGVLGYDVSDQIVEYDPVKFPLAPPRQALSSPAQMEDPTSREKTESVGFGCAAAPF